MGFKTTIAKASTISNSFRTTVPAAIINQFNLEDGDILEWEMKAEDGKLSIQITPKRK
jgi:bifunctional DNA-binding transcriptional regulator/antitoxin component of YhaV-PrlF toxin-antitoxin module